METIFINIENSKINESHKFLFNLSLISDLRSLNKHVALQNLSIYYTWKNMRQQYKNNKLKKIAPTWNNEFDLPHGSYSVLGIQNYFEFIIKNYETLPPNLLILFYIIRIFQNKRCM